MQHRWRIFTAAAFLTGMTSLQSVRVQAQPPAAEPAQAAAHRATVERYCATCHNPRLRTGGLVLETSHLVDPSAHAETWEKVVRKLRAGTMPPQGVPRPAQAATDALATWVETTIDRAALAKPNPGRRPAVHRLNRVEYTNAIRDLLGLEIDGNALLPPDDSGYGFDNIADVLTVSPMLTERYLAAAAKISRIAVGDPTLRPITETFTVSKYLRQDDRVSEDLPFGSRGGNAIRYYFPVDADYVVKIFFDRTYDGRVRGLADSHDLEVRLDGVLVRRISVGGAAAAGLGRNQPIDGTEVKFAATAGPRTLGVTFVKKAAEPEGMRRPLYSVTTYEYAGDVTVAPAVGSLELRGPYDVRGPGNSPSRQRLFVCQESTEACARKILAGVVRRAYRRPVTDADLAPLMSFYRPASKAGGLDRGIEAALRRILVSPGFLFRLEQDPASASSGAPYRISDLELASRLSFFLWSSIPDDELLDLAAARQLGKPAILEQQVKRLLANPRSTALVDNFAGQWLYVRNIRLVQPDPLVFPEFDENLRQAFEREIGLFLGSQIRDNQSVRSLLTADYTFVNERVARHYGIPKIYGSHFRRVTVDDERKGLLGKGGILTVTSYPHRTSPVLRGKWLLENLLGAPPPPPPPDVPALQDKPEGGPALTVRARMEEHRSNPACASCHRIMDPLGFALENFDAVGQWRTADGGTPIDASTVLADGKAVEGPAALRRALDSRPEEFVTTVTSKLLTYALGRGTEYYDAPAIRRIVRDAAADDYRWTSIVLGITKSVPFQMRMKETAE